MKNTDEACCHVQLPQTLTSLHVEVLSRILMHVENSDIPAAMLTCKSLYSGIMTRQFWYDRIHRLRKEHLISPPEEELEKYTVPELEQWTLRRIRARSTLPTQLQLRSRDAEPLPYIFDNVILVPGGRWLLVTHTDLRVYFFDLDSHDLEQRLLFKLRCPEFHNTRGRIFGNHIWMDRKAPRLSFRYATCHVEAGDGSMLSGAQIHQVDLLGHGADATLVAHTIATFRTHMKNTTLFSFAINNRYFVQDRGDDDNAEIEIYDYSQVLGRLDYPLIECSAFPLEENAMGMDFINEDVFLINCWELESLYIFNIESPTSIKRLHTIHWCPGWFPPSRARWTSEASLITWVNESAPDRGADVVTIHGVVIPHNSTVTPWTIELGDFTQKNIHELMLGIFISMSCNHTDNISRIGHEWDFTPQSNPTHVSILEYPVDQPEELSTFDEDTGRSVHFGHDKMKVVDIVAAG